jgi:nucleoside-diphosphate-sugar epimerase/glyoxylase-like metal-dependent hydrolase (beta-lactamase superfamily II)
MVARRLLQLTEAELGPEPLRILVTGGTGFVGSSLATLLMAAGHKVTVCGRNRYRYPAFSLSDSFVEADLTDRQTILNLCRDQDIVYHAGARSSPWGTRSEFAAANVQGTQNIVDGCLQSAVPRLVHVSSTAIFFDFQDKLKITDASPLPEHFCCDYAGSKAQAERIVQAAVARGLNAVTIRARAVFGPGDNSLLPRLIAAARESRLRQIGDGQNVIDMTYIDNLIAALILAARRGTAGSVCTITNDEPVVLWQLLHDVLNQLGVRTPLKKVSKSVAMAAASCMEWQHRFFQRPGEPVMTRYAVGLFSRTQTFDQSAARSTLNYSPLVSMTDAVRETLESIMRKEETATATTVKLRMFSTGYTSHRAWLAEKGASRTEFIRFHAMIGIIDHPAAGLTLFDTGYAPRFFEATKRWPYKLYRWTTPVETSAELSAVNVLQRHGIEPASVKRIILSHFHADHVCGLKDFPNAEVLASASAWQAIQGKRGLAAVKRAILPDLFPHDLEKRLKLIEHFHGPGFGPFTSSHDVFGDGSVRMLDLSGHAAGQIGLLLQREEGRSLLAADAVWTSRTFREDLPLTPGFRWLAASAVEANVSKKKLHEVFVQFPNVEIIPTHCPEIAARYGFDVEVDRLLNSASGDANVGSVTCSGPEA